MVRMVLWVSMGSVGISTRLISAAPPPDAGGVVRIWRLPPVS